MYQTILGWQRYLRRTDFYQTGYKQPLTKSTLRIRSTFSLCFLMLFLTWGSSLCGLPPCTESSRLLLELPPWNYTWNIFINYHGDEYFLRYFWNYVFPSLPPRSFLWISLIPLPPQNDDQLSSIVCCPFYYVHNEQMMIAFPLWMSIRFGTTLLTKPLEVGEICHSPQGRSQSGERQTPTSFASRLIILLGWWSVLVVQYR